MSETKPLIKYSDAIEGLTEKAISYHRIKLRFEVFEKIVTLLIYLILLIIGFPNYMRDISPFGKNYSFMSVFWVFFFFFIVGFIVEVAMNFYDELIERKFEFSTRSNRKFVVDLIKELILSFIILGIVIEAIFFGLYKSPNFWWIYAFFGYFIFAGILQALSPYLISLFTKIEPLEKGEIRTKVEELAKKMNLKYKEIYLWKMSEQTTKANAAVVGFGSSIRIILGDTFINNFRPDEVEIAMAHEIAHQQNKDTYRITIFLGIISLIAFILTDLGFNAAINFFNLTGKSDPAAVGYFIFAISLILEVLNIFNLAFTRTREKAADIVAIQTIKNLEVYESTFTRLGQINLSYPNPSKLEVILRYSHPPIKDRVNYGKNYI